MSWRGYDALPPYFGGKRKLCPRIFREIARVYPTSLWHRLRLVDPFLGGGAVSLYARARGFEVLCGDIAERSAIVGRALIDNYWERLTELDLQRLFVPSSANEHLIESAWVPDYFTPQVARFLDNAFAVAGQVGNSSKRSLLQLLLVKHILALRPHAHFRAPNAFNRPFAEGRFDDIRTTYWRAIAANAEHPLPALRRLARTINRAILPTTRDCRFLKIPAMPLILCGEGAHVLYLDPPYPGTLAYEDEYAMLDALLGDDLERSPYSQRDGLQAFSELLEVCDSFRLWVISYGNAVASLEEVTAAVERFRSVRAIEIAYSHLASTASRAKNEANREFLLIAPREH